MAGFNKDASEGSPSATPTRRQGVKFKYNVGVPQSSAELNPNQNVAYFRNFLN